MRIESKIIITVSAIVTLLGIFGIWFWYGQIYSYYCPVARQCAGILSSNNPTGIYGIIFAGAGLTGLSIGIVLTRKK